MKAESTSRIVKLGIINFWRNRWLSLAATLIMTLTLLIISVFVIMSLIIGKTTDSIRSKMDISVYFQDSAATEQIVDLQKKLITRADVKEVKYISKEDALEILKTQPQGKTLANIITPEDNPLPRSLDIKANEAESLDEIAGYIEQDEFKPIIHNVSYQENKKIIDRLIAITSFIKETGWGISIVFVIISILVILNTIRLTIFTRKDEIEIMRLVGASDIFIRVPFIVEGLIYGILATIISTVIIGISMVLMNTRIEQYLGTTMSQKMIVFFWHNLWLIILLELATGLIIGAFCSILSIRKYIKL